MKHKRVKGPLPIMSDSFCFISKEKSPTNMKEGKGGEKQVFLKAVQTFCVEIFLQNGHSLPKIMFLVYQFLRLSFNLSFKSVFE